MLRAAPDPAATATRLARLLGTEAEDSAPTLGRVEMRFERRAIPTARCGGYRLRGADMDVVRRAVERLGLVARTDGQALSLPPEAAFGQALTFSPA